MKAITIVEYDRAARVVGTQHLLDVFPYQQNASVEAFFLQRYAAAYRAELDAFVTALRAGAMPAPGGEDGLRALELADAATQSAKTGETVRL